MGIELASSFTRKAAVPLDDISVVADLTARDAIVSGVRYQGMVCYVVSEGANFQLIGGITNSNWEDFGSGGGGGGGSLAWEGRDVTNTPETFFDDALKMWRFPSDVYNTLWVTFKVPASYKPGKEIVLKGCAVRVNSTDATKKVRMMAQAQLIKTGTVYDSTSAPSQQSSNTSIAVNATAMKLLAVGDLDLTTDGEVDGTAVAPGDRILLQFLRDIATADNVAVDAEVIADDLEISFNG